MRFINVILGNPENDSKMSLFSLVVLVLYIWITVNISGGMYIDTPIGEIVSYLMLFIYFLIPFYGLMRGLRGVKHKRYFAILGVILNFFVFCMYAWLWHIFVITPWNLGPG